MENWKNYIVATGDKVRSAIEGKAPIENKHPMFTYLNLKDGESARGFLLTDNFVAYLKHTDFKKGIKSHTCKNPKNLPHVTCLSCEHGVSRQMRTIVPFWNVDTREIQVFDASRTVMKAVYAFMDEYEEDALTTPVVITRSGTAKDTTYSIMPTRVKTAEKLLFSVPDDVKIDDEFIAYVLNIRDDKDIRKLLGLPEETDASDTASANTENAETLVF